MRLTSFCKERHPRMKRIIAFFLALCLTIALLSGCALADYSTLKKGSKGKAVLQLKQRMYELGYFTSTNFSNEFNDVTVKRLKDLQEKNGLAADGIATPEVQALIFSDDCLPASAQPLSAADEGTAAALPAVQATEKATSVPMRLRVSYQVSEQLINGKQSFVYKETVKTSLPQVDEMVNALADQYETDLAGNLQASKNPKRNSRLDIHIVHSKSGLKALSFLVLARTSFNRKQLSSPFETRVFDMESGAQVTLSDLFPQDSPAWDVLSQEVRKGLSAYFPKEQADEGALNALCEKDAIGQTPFMLGQVCLTLHYEASVLYKNRPTLMQVRIPYGLLRDMMTDYGRELTDNSMYKMVALTFDDGPSYTNTINLLNNLRHAGAQATFFLVGDRIEEYKDVVMRENDENHSLQSHHYKHVDADKSTVERVQSYTKKFYDALTNAVGTAPVMLRAPYGNFKMFKKAKVNLPFIEWDVDTKDWTGKSSAGVLSVVKDLTKDGSIILMHDIKDKTAESARRAMEWLESSGYLCISVEDLFTYNGQPMTPNKIFFRIDPYTGE